MAILMIFDGAVKPPAFCTTLHGDTVQELMNMADDLAKSEPSKLYEVYDNIGRLAYRR